MNRMNEYEYFVSVERAVEIASNHPPHLNIENVKITNCLNRVITKNIPSLVTDPPFDNSSMDGYAVIHSDTINASLEQPISLQIVGVSQAGTNPLSKLKPGQAIKIMTGARIPPGADSIVLVEEAELISDNTEFGKVKLFSKSRINYIRIAGENMKKNQIMLQAGEKIDPYKIGLMATMGYSEMPVYSKLKVSIISTGDELVKPGTDLKTGQIYESNSYFLAALIEELGHEPIIIDLVNDNLDELREKMNTASNNSDMIITSGGVSMGEFDLVRKIMEEEGDIKFWRIKMKPGSPPLFGLWNNTPLFGLPGNPISSQLVFLMIVKPWLCKIFGTKSNPHQIIKAKLTKNLKKISDVLLLRRVLVESTPEGMVAKPALHQGSGNSSSTVTSNAVTLIQPGQSADMGDIIDVLFIR